MAPHINECGFNNFHESTSAISSGNQSLKGTQREKALSKSTNMGIWVVGTLIQFLIKGT